MDKYEFTPIIVTKDKNGNLILDEEKLKEIVKEAYINGYLAGQISKSNESPTITHPTTPLTPYIPPLEYPYKTPFWYDKFYCISDITNEMRTPYVKVGD